MNKHLSNGALPNEERDALLTAYALDQLEAAERDSVAAQLANDPVATAYVNELRQLASIARPALLAEEAPEASLQLRKTLDQCLEQREVAAKTTSRRWLRTAIAVAAFGSAACVAGLLLWPPAPLQSLVGMREQDSHATPPSTTTPADELALMTQDDATSRTIVLSDGVEFDAPAAGYSLAPEATFEKQHAAGVTPLSSTPHPSAAPAPTPLPSESSPAPLAGAKTAAASEARQYRRAENRELALGALAKADKRVADNRPLDRAALTEGEIEEMRRIDRLSPGAVHNEQYDQIIENPFLPSKDYALSTFSIDVDTASYANTRRFLTQGTLPPPSAVRIEELINYFAYDDPQPAGDAPFSVNMELAQCPWTPGHHLLRVGLKGREIAKEKRPNSNLVFLLDVSGSMQSHNKLPLVKEAMRMLVEQLTENDMVTIAVYAGQEGLALDTTSGDQKEKILAAIDNLSAGGSTHASAGITLAYQKAQQNFLKDGTNRVILCTDGDFNVGITNDEALVDLITEKAKSNVFLSVLGFGMGNLKDAKMEKLADKGNGNYGYIDTAKEAKKVLVEQMTGSLITIAKDVKIQIEFNPAKIASYRQIGYENRVLAAKDFDDDTKDAGEIGAGHGVTALYEVVLVGNEAPAEKKEAAIDGVPLKYQKPGESTTAAPTADLELTEAAQSGELCTVKLRYKEPTGDQSALLEFPLKQEPMRFGQASENLRFASAVAAFGMLLRNSEHRGGATMSAVEEIASAALGKDPHGYRAEFLELVRKAEALQK